MKRGKDYDFTLEYKGAFPFDLHTRIFPGITDDFGYTANFSGVAHAVILEFNEGKFGPERNRAYIKIIPTVCFEALESRNFDS